MFYTVASRHTTKHNAIQTGVIFTLLKYQIENLREFSRKEPNNQSINHRNETKPDFLLFFGVVSNATFNIINRKQSIKAQYRTS